METQGVGVTDTVYFGGQPLARLSAGQWADLVYGPTGLMAEVPGTQNGVPTYRVTDHLGTIAGTLLADGTFVNPMDHAPFGRVTSGNTSDPFQFTGFEHDGESGLEHAPYRQHSSTSGRWISPDPYDGSSQPANPQSLNRYSYALNNPLSLVDPLGLDSSCPETQFRGRSRAAEEENNPDGNGPCDTTQTGPNGGSGGNDSSQVVNPGNPYILTLYAYDFSIIQDPVLTSSLLSYGAFASWIWRSKRWWRWSSCPK